MELQQLRYIVTIAENGLNVSAASRLLNTSQPGLSQQIKRLEQELGFEIFERRGRSFARVTPDGERVIGFASSILREARSLQKLSGEVTAAGVETLSIATTHTQARYVLPPVVQAFRERYPGVRLHLHQGTSEQIAELTQRRGIDLAIASGGEEQFGNLVRLPCFRWRREVIVRAGHPLTQGGPLTLARLAEFPIVTYVFSLSGRASLLTYFERAGIEPRIALTARDADVIKTYVRLGLGVGVIAALAVDTAADQDLVRLDASHLFDTQTTWVGFRRGAVLRPHTYEFIELLAPHLSRRLVSEAQRLDSQGRLDRALEDVHLPVRAGS